MRKLTASLALVVAVGFLNHARAGELSAVEILNKCDDVLNAPKDQNYKIKAILIDKDGKEKSREMAMLQRGSDQRVVKFTAPADQRGIAFLSLPNDVLYLYLPAFEKVRRVASSVKNTSFAGTDFSYEDMEAIRWSSKWLPRVLKEENECMVLEMSPKPGQETDYSKMVVWVRNDTSYPIRVEHYDKAGKLYKILLHDKIEQVQGYWVAKENTMEDVRKQHKTRLVLSDIRFDSGLSDDVFTERNLTR